MNPYVLSETHERLKNSTLLLNHADPHEEASEQLLIYDQEEVVAEYEYVLPRSLYSPICRPGFCISITHPLFF